MIYLPTLYYVALYCVAYFVTSNILPSSILCCTGWSIMTAKEYELITRARKRYIRWERCHFVTLFGTFWYLVSKKSHNHSVIIHLWRLWRSKTVEICKIHRKLMIFKSHYCFANIGIGRGWGWWLGVVIMHFFQKLIIFY